MSRHATEPTTQAAMKSYRCNWCWQAIKPGETYRRYRFYSDGDAGTTRMHPECFAVMKEEADKEGGWFDWTPGQERPAIAQEGGA